VSGDTLNSIALALATSITKDIDMQNLGINAVPTANYLSLKSVSTNVTSFEGSVSSGATENIRVGITGNFVQNAEITGTKTTGDIITLKVIDPSLSGGSKSVSYTVLSTDTLSSIATGLKNAVNADVSLSALGVTATTFGQVVTIRSASETAVTHNVILRLANNLILPTKKIWPFVYEIRLMPTIGIAYSAKIIGGVW